MATVKDIKIDTKILESISKMAKEAGTNEEILIHNILSEAIEEYDDCDLLKRLKKGETEIKEGKGIKLSMKELSERLGVDPPERV